MLRNYLTVAIRNLVRHKVYSFINIFGLAMGMACAIHVFLWVQDELSYDRFHKNADQIYRAIYTYPQGKKGANVHGPLAKTLVNTYPEIINATRIITPPTRVALEYHEKGFYEDRIILADPSFLEMFTFPLVNGDPKTALLNPHNIVITEAMARKYFGEESPIGKTMTGNGVFHFTVTGVMRDCPVNSHLQFDFIIPFAFMRKIGFDIDEWIEATQPGNTYIQLDNQRNRQGISQKIEAFVPRYFPRSEIKLQLQPLKEIYLRSDCEGGIGIQGDMRHVCIFSSIAFFVLLIACINFMNLATAQSSGRSKEIGLRKVIGATRGQLVRQFFGESILLTLTAFALGMMLVELTFPFINQIGGKTLGFNYSDPGILLALAMIVLSTAMLAGSYPAWMFSSFTPVEILKGNRPLISSVKRDWRAVITDAVIRKFLIVLQFSLSIGLIIGTAVIYTQLDYIKTKKLGFNRENVIYTLLGNTGGKYDALKNEVLKTPGTLGMTLSKNLPSLTLNRWSATWEGQQPDKYVAVKYKPVDHDYIEFFDIEIVQGRNFSKEFGTDASEAFILNEETIRQMEMDAPIGKGFSLFGREGKIIGVIKDTHFESLHNRIEPQAFYVFRDLSSMEAQTMGVLYIRIKPDDISNTIRLIENVWKKFNPHIPFEPHFLDIEYEQSYISEQRMGRLFDYFSLLAILISCLGLFGLASFTAEQRTKEIGIRKVLGASIHGIVAMLSKEFIRWILLANLFAWPMAWYAMNRWLANFAYRIDIGWWPFVLAGTLALIIAVLTVSYQAIRAATTHPVEALRYE